MTDPWPDGSDDVRPPDGAAWDLLVVGAGTAGIVAARTAAGFGASVLLVERDRTGGDCLWTGCVPSKALLAAAHAAADARSAARLGVHADGVRVDFAAVMRHVHAAIATIAPDDAPATLRAAGVQVVHGRARFTGPDRVDIDGATVPFRQALIATGSAPSLPDVPGLADAHPLTSDTVWDLDALPARLLVLGGGSIGCELGQAFARLGARVTILEAGPTILPREEPDAADLLHATLVADEVSVRTETEATAFRPAADEAIDVVVGSTTLTVDAVLVAVGRRPRTAELGLDDAGVGLDRDGYVVVDEQLRTTNPCVWAAGDVTAYPQFTHVAGVHGSTAATNAVLGLRRRVDAATIPRVTFTQPEVAAFGTPARDGHTVQDVAHRHVDRAVAEDHTDGFSRLVLDRRGRIVGATVVGPRAGESLAVLVLAASQGLRARDLAAAMHAYPTYGDGPWNAAIAQVRDGLRRPPTSWATRLLAAVRRRRAGRAQSR